MTSEGLSEARISKVHDVDETRSEDCSVLRSEPFAVVAKSGRWGLSRELRRDLIVRIAGEGAAHVDGVLTGTVDVEIDFPD